MAAGAVGESGGLVQASVVQPFRLTRRERLGVTDECEQPGPRGQVGREHRECQPGLVDRELPRREATEPSVLGVPDAVLDPGVDTVLAPELGELPGRGVGDQGFVAPAAALFEQRQLRRGGVVRRAR